MSRSNRSNSVNEKSKLATLDDIQGIMMELKNDLVKSFKDEISRLELRLDTLDSRIENLEKYVDNCRLSQNKQQLEIDEMKSAILQLDFFKAEVFKEIEERESRRNNIMIYGLSEANMGTLSNNKDCDVNKINELLSYFGHCDIKLSECRRVGKIVNGKTRPLKVVLPSQDIKRTILNQAKSLKNSDKFRRVFIHQDRTKMQQQEWFDLRKELEMRKQSGEDVVIYNGKICPRSSLRNFPRRF